MKKTSCGDVLFCRPREKGEKGWIGPEGWIYAGLLGPGRALALEQFAAGKLPENLRAFARDPVRFLSADEVRWDTCGRRYVALYTAAKYQESGGWKNEPTRQAATVVLNDQEVYELAQRFSVDRRLFRSLRDAIRRKLAPAIDASLVDWKEVETMIEAEIGS